MWALMPVKECTSSREDASRQRARASFFHVLLYRQPRDDVAQIKVAFPQMIKI